MAITPTALGLWRKLQKLPLGKRTFTRLICLKAPYFASIRPQFVELEPGHCVATIHKHRSVTNHIGGIHAIALCNLAELAGGLMTEVSVPASHRWIPRGMTVEYLKVARSDVRAVASFESKPVYGASGSELPALITVYDNTDTPVFRAEIRMWVSPRKPPVAG